MDRGQKKTHCPIRKAPDVSLRTLGSHDLEILDDDYQPETPMEKACFEYVRAASEAPDAVPRHLLDNLKKHLTPPQIVELACVVGFWKFYNTVHDSLHIPVEEHLLSDTRYVDV